MFLCVAIPGVGAAAVAATSAVLRGAVQGLQRPVLAALNGLLLRPVVLSSGVLAATTVTRGVGASLLGAVLTYGVLRSLVAPLVGLRSDPLPSLLGRVALAALGVAGSVPLVRGVLAANNALCALLVRSAPRGPAGLIRPLVGGLGLSAAPALLGVGPDIVALAVVVGVAALACFYLVRSAEIALLALLLPLAAALWALPAAAGVWRALVGELLVSVFVQAAQAAVLLVFAVGLSGGPADAGQWLVSLASLALLFRCRMLVGRAVGILLPWAGDAAGPAGWIRGAGLGLRLGPG